jgi:alpha-beta hydrolase superfamily lysophospholipase
MKHFEFSIPTKDGLDLYAQGWEPDQDPKAFIYIVHGLGEHSGRYNHVAVEFNEAGYAVLALDLRGHGKSPGKRGYTPSFDVLLDDVDIFISKCGKSGLQEPYFVYGHSMGANIVMDYALRRKPEISGVIATGPSFRLAFEPPAIQVALGRILSRVIPKFAQPSGLETQALSRDQKVVQKYENDPLVHDRVSGQLFFGFMDAGTRLLEQSSNFPFPLLLMHGGADRITSPQACRDFAEKMDEKCTLKIWEDFYHEIHNEPEKAQVFDMIIEWLDKHIG